MELSSVMINVEYTPGLNGDAGPQDQSSQSTPDQYSSTPDHSNTTSSSASSPLFAASPAESRPDRPSSGGVAVATTTVTVIVDGPGRRARALKSLKESIPHTMKLQKLQSSERKFQKDGSWHKKSVRRLSKELYVIVSWYALLQSALFAAVAQTSTFTCEDWWGPVGIAGMVTLGTFLSALDKLRRMGQQRQQVLLFQARQNAVYDSIDFLLLHGSDCNLDSLEPEHTSDPPSDPGLLFVCLVLGFLLGFSGLIIISCLRMLCGPPCKCSSQ